MQNNEILVAYGMDIERVVTFVLERAALADLIPKKDAKIGIKPNLVVSRPAEDGATTHPEVVAALLAYLRRSGFQNLTILEGAWVGDSTARAFEACGYTQIAKEYGAKLVDTQKDSHTRRDCAGLPIQICDAALEMDFMINVPVLKGHCQTRLTCALKNNKGVIPNAEKRRFHTLGLHRPIACLNTVVRNDFILVDGICGDLDFEEGGNPLPSGRILAARDPVLCDALCATLLGYRPEEVEYIPQAAGLGVGSMDLERAVVTQLNESDSAPATPVVSRKVRRLEPYICQKDACSACYAALVRTLSLLGPAQRDALPGPVCVGQGFRGQEGGIGSGQCTSAFQKTIPGCPPRAVDILAALEAL